ncbi:hypothetical protein [Gloeothece citriformis]|uniref:hypothetical protein n=1 Tax=Gloeothece citriformis TaxID=2546356 RepID=UPI00059DD3DB|nr:hypothetical protein [Gloeothece citriformis]
MKNVLTPLAVAIKFPPSPPPVKGNENYLEQLADYYQQLKDYYDRASNAAATQLGYVRTLLHPNLNTFNGLPSLNLTSKLEDNLSLLSCDHEVALRDRFDQTIRKTRE